MDTKTFTLTSILLNPDVWTILLMIVSAVLGSKWWAAKKAVLLARRDIVSVAATLLEQSAQNVVARVETEVVKPYKITAGTPRLDANGQAMAQAAAEAHLTDVLVSTGSEFAQGIAPAIVKEAVKMAVAKMNPLPEQKKITGDIAALIKVGDAELRS